MTHPAFLFHGSAAEHPDGRILLGRRALRGFDAVGPMSADIEDILEAQRPHDCIRRVEAVYLSENPDDLDASGAYCDYISVVETPQGVTRHDIAWMTFMESSEGDDAWQALCAKRYWEGTSFPSHPKELAEMGFPNISKRDMPASVIEWLSPPVAVVCCFDGEENMNTGEQMIAAVKEMYPTPRP